MSSNDFFLSFLPGHEFTMACSPVIISIVSATTLFGSNAHFWWRKKMLLTPAEWCVFISNWLTLSKETIVSNILNIFSNRRWGEISLIISSIHWVSKLCIKRCPAYNFKIWNLIKFIMIMNFLWEWFSNWSSLSINRWISDRPFRQFVEKWWTIFCNCEISKKGHLKWWEQYVLLCMKKWEVCCSKTMWGKEGYIRLWQHPVGWKTLTVSVWMIRTGDGGWLRHKWRNNKWLIDQWFTDSRLRFPERRDETFACISIIELVKIINTKDCCCHSNLFEEFRWDKNLEKSFRRTLEKT